MKKIINGKTYDTETAEELAARCENCRSFEYVNETLYKTKKGAYFLAGEGGPMSRYSVPDGNGSSSGSDIIPLSEEQAKAWTEEYANSKYCEIFGEPEEA